MNAEDVLKNVLWKFGERFGIQLVTFIVSVVLARLLTPSEYGVIAIVLVFLMIADVFVTDGFGNALIQKKEVDNLDYSSVFFFNVGFSIVIYFLLFICAPLIARFYVMPELKLVIRVISLRVLLSGINSVQNAYVAITLQFRKQFIASCIGCICASIVGIMLAVNGFGVWSIVGQYLISSLINTLTLHFVIKWKPQFIFSFQRLKGLINFAWKIMISSLIDTLYQEIRSLIIGKIYTVSELGQFDRGTQYPKLLSQNVNAAISSVLFPVIAKEQNDKMRVKEITRRAMQTGSFVVWPAMTGLAITASKWVPLILSEKWIPCIPYVIIACVTYALIPINVANLQALKAIGRSDVYLKLEVIKKTINMWLLLAVLNRGVLLIALVAIPGAFIGLLLNAYPNSKLLLYKLSEQFMDILPNAVISIVMGLLVFMIGLLPIGSFPVLVLQLFGGAFFYCIIAYLTRNSSFIFLINTIKKIIGYGSYPTSRST